jgi:hypothetical protein
LNLHETLKILVGFFKQGDGKNDINNPAILKQMEHLLLLHGMETWELIHQYHLERREEQMAMEAANHGLLTVKMQFVEDLLRIEVLNARNLHPMDANGKNIFIRATDTDIICIFMVLNSPLNLYDSVL